jgi:hypothetical protein
MTKKYVIKTESGNFYEIIDESHLWHPDTWIIMFKGERQVILTFSKAKLKQTLMDVVRGRVDYRKSAWRNLEGGIKTNFESGACIGHSVLFIEEKLIKPYLKTRKLPPKFWEEVVTKNCGHTSKIIEVYIKIH